MDFINHGRSVHWGTCRIYENTDESHYLRLDEYFDLMFVASEIATRWRFFVINIEIIEHNIDSKQSKSITQNFSRCAATQQRNNKKTFQSVRHPSKKPLWAKNSFAGVTHQGMN